MKVWKQETGQNISRSQARSLGQDCGARVTFTFQITVLAGKDHGAWEAEEAGWEAVK